MPFENPPRTNRIIRKGTPRGQVVYKVGGKDYVFMEKYDTYPDLRPDTRNPRYAYLTKDGEVTEQEMLELLQSDDDTRRLKESIETNEGLCKPLIIRVEADGTKRIIDGNQRWAAWNWLHAADPEKYRLVHVQVVPPEMSEAEVLEYLGVHHVNKPKDWSSYSQSHHIRKMLGLGTSKEQVARKMGLTEREVDRRVTTCELIDEFGKFSGLSNADDYHGPMYEFSKLKKALLKDKTLRKALFVCLMNNDIENTKSVRSLIQLQETRADLVAKIAAGQTTLEQAITTAAAADPLSVKGGFFSELVRTSNRLDNEHMFLKALVSNSTSAKQVVRRIHKQLESLM